MNTAQAPVEVLPDDGSATSTDTANKPTTTGTKAPVKTGTTVTTHTTTGTTNPGTTAPAPAPTPVPSLVWSFKINSTDANGLKSTSVSLTADSKIYDLGMFSGDCKTVAAADVTTANEVSAVTCLYKGKGVELGVFRAGSKFVVEKADIEAADAGSPAKRGVFTNIVTLD